MSFNFTDRDLRVARSVLELAEPDQGRHVVTLTDEEITVLDGVQNPQQVALPWLSDQDGDHSTLGLVALRSLVARGLVQAVESPDDESVELSAAPEIAGSLVLRRTGRHTLAAHRTTSLGESWWYGYLHEQAVLEEDVLASGHHTFGVYLAEHVPARLLPFVDPQDRATRAGTPRRVTRTDLPDAVARAPFADATVVTTLTSIDVEKDEANIVSLYAGPSGVTVLAGAGADDPDATIATSVDRAGLTALLRGLLNASPADSTP